MESRMEWKLFNCIVICFIANIVVQATDNETTTSMISSSQQTTLEPIVGKCEENTCRNGECFLTESGNQICRCSRYFQGEKCELLDASTYEFYQVNAMELTLSWAEPLQLVNYSAFVFVDQNHPSKTAQFIDINMAENQKNFTIKPLTSDGVRSNVCILDKESAVFKNLSTDEDILKDDTYKLWLDVDNDIAVNCLKVKTGYDGFGPFSLAAIVVSSSMALLVIILFLTQIIASCRVKEKRDRMLADMKDTLDFLKRTSTKERGEARDKEDSNDLHEGGNTV